ncbi:MAG TPA: hypothetical protein VES73_07555 [Lamprocystis sp. (in: g-proteobacteria)]|nr:hypothetical protein [Lamprocystis sp. (in: g-proteobacteria)]
MKLFQSFFGGGESRGRYPESLIEEAIERAVAATDPRLRVLPGYRRTLRPSAIHAIDQVIGLVDDLPAYLTAGHREYSDDPRLAAVFAGARDMLDIFSRSPALTEFLAAPEGAGTERVTALLVAERVEKRILGVDLVGDRVQHDVSQVAVSFSGHRLLDPQVDETQTRRQLERRAFDHLLTLALGQIAELREERADLARQRDLLRRKLEALERGSWTFNASPGKPIAMGDLNLELAAVEQQLGAVGPDTGALAAHLDIVAGVLGEAERHLWADETALYLDAMNLQRDPQDPSARRMTLHELHNSRGVRVVMLPLSLAPADLPPREDLVTAAERYLY